MRGSETWSGERALNVLALCLGNICRSPLAEVLLRRELAAAGVHAHVESAGTGGWHAGGPADPRSAEIARRHGMDLGSHVAQQLRQPQIGQFDVILAMDASNLEAARNVAGNSGVQVALMRDFDPLGPGDVPDPYYGGPDGFQQVYDMLERSARTFAERARMGTLRP